MPIVRELQVRYTEKEVHDPRVGQPIVTAEGVARIMGFLRHAVDEEVWALVLDVEHKLVGIYQVAKGGRHETMLDAGSLYRTALLAEGSYLILVHNHPSAGVRPSQADINGTQGVLMAGIALHVPLLDHVILSSKETYSFAQSGMLAFLEAKVCKALGVPNVPEVKHPEEREAEVRNAFANLARKPAEAKAEPQVLGGITGLLVGADG